MYEKFLRLQKKYLKNTFLLLYVQEDTAEARIRLLCLQAIKNLEQAVQFFSSVIPL